jgi:glucose/arabinose dehydrogenase
VPGYNQDVPMTDFAKFPNAIGAKWSSGSPTIAPSGATFLSGAQWGDWNGSIAVAVLKGRHLRVFHFGPSGNITGFDTAITTRGRLRSAVQGPNGYLFITTDNGGNNDVILRVRPT